MNRTQIAARKYVGGKATQYNAKRRGKAMWPREIEVLRPWLEAYLPGAHLLDCPVGTGRLLHFWTEFGFSVTGVEISPDMLAEAYKEPLAKVATLMQGDAFNLPFDNGAFDVTASLRFITLIETDDMVRALYELQRVTRSEIVFNTTVGTARNAHPLEAISSAILPGWQLVEHVAIHKPDFRMFRLRAQ